MPCVVASDPLLVRARSSTRKSTSGQTAFALGFGVCFSGSSSVVSCVFYRTEAGRQHFANQLNSIRYCVQEVQAATATEHHTWKARGVFCLLVCVCVLLCVCRPATTTFSSPISLPRTMTFSTIASTMSGRGATSGELLHDFTYELGCPMANPATRSWILMSFPCVCLCVCVCRMALQHGVWRRVDTQTRTSKFVCQRRLLSRTD